MQRTRISWTEFVWNPTIGCSLPLSSTGCARCYARKLHNTRHKAYLAGKKLPKQYRKPFEEVQLFQDRLEQPLHRKKASRIFVDSMSDIFDSQVPSKFIDKIMAIIALCPQHTFQLLTKRIDRALEYFTDRSFNDVICNVMNERHIQQAYKKSWIDKLAGRFALTEKWATEGYESKYRLPQSWPLCNLWLGVTVCNQKEADEKIPILLQIPAAVRFVSIEPMLGPIDLATWLVCEACADTYGGKRHKANIETIMHCKNPQLNWIVCGGETGPGARPMHPDWVRSIRDQCQAAGVPFFLKSLGEWIHRQNLSSYHKSLLYGGFSKTWPRYESDFYRLGKKNAGHLLDGKEYREWPK